MITKTVRKKEKKNILIIIPSLQEMHDAIVTILLSIDSRENMSGGGSTTKYA